MGGWDGGVARWAAPISQKKNAMGSQPPVAAATATSPPAVPVARLPTDGINVVEVGPAYVGRRPRTALFGVAMCPRGALLHPPRPPPPTPRLFDQPHQPTARHTGDDARRRCESPSSRDEKKSTIFSPLLRGRVRQHAAARRRARTRRGRRSCRARAARRGGRYVEHRTAAGGRAWRSRGGAGPRLACLESSTGGGVREGPPRRRRGAPPR